MLVVTVFLYRLHDGSCLGTIVPFHCVSLQPVRSSIFAMPSLVTEAPPGFLSNVLLLSFGEPRRMLRATCRSIELAGASVMFKFCYMQQNEYPTLWHVKQSVFHCALARMTFWGPWKHDRIIHRQGTTHIAHWEAIMSDVPAKTCFNKIYDEAALYKVCQAFKLPQFGRGPFDPPLAVRGGSVWFDVHPSGQWPSRGHIWHCEHKVFNAPNSEYALDTMYIYCRSLGHFAVPAFPPMFL